MSDRQFSTYQEFFAFYLQQHSHSGNRWLHATGTLLGFLVVLVAIVTRHYLWGLLWIPVAYGCAWAGHFLVEKNKPATFGHPWWSFISDFRMLAMMVRGELKNTNADKSAASGQK